jgi:arylsulfotransferase ASST
MWKSGPQSACAGGARTADIRYLLEGGERVKSYQVPAVAIGLLATVSCHDQRGVTAPDPVNVTAVSFTQNLGMVTSAEAHVECSGAVAYLQISYTASGLDSGSTPRLPVSACPADVNVLGLLQSTRYVTRVTAWGNAADSQSVGGPSLVTGPLPVNLPQFSIQSSAVRPSGLTAFAVLTSAGSDGYAMIVDSIGRVRWYVVTSNGSVVDLQPQPNGHYALTIGSSATQQEYDELDVSANLLRRWRVGGPYVTDNHELRLTPRGTGLMLGWYVKTMDLSPYGGMSTAQVVVDILQEVDSLGQTVFQWDAFDHFSITDIDPSIPLDSPRVDWNHGNAIEVDGDGNYLLSFRNLSEVTKINSTTGQVLWRWGGVKNEFTFVGDTVMFSMQHGIRRLANGNYILFDDGNSHSPPFSRAVEYRLDQTAKTATLVWAYRPTPDIFSPFLGFAQRLANGNTLVTFGPQGTIQEVSPTGELVWQLTLANNWVYRAYRIRSLYDPGLVDQSPRP